MLYTLQAPILDFTDKDIRSMKDNKVMEGLDPCLQEAEQLPTLQDNYLYSIIRSTNTSPTLEVKEQVDQTPQNNLIPAKQDFGNVEELVTNIPESQKIDTSYSSQQHTVPINISPQDINLDPNLLDDQLQDQEIDDPAEQGTLVYDPVVPRDKYEDQAMEDICDCTAIQMGNPVIEPFTTSDVRIPTEKVDCLFITECLQKYLEEYQPSLDKQAFLDLYNMISLLDQYLYDNPRQHIHCMSHDNEYVTLLNHAIHLCIDTSTFPTVWAVLYSPGYTRQQTQVCKIFTG